MRHRANYYQIMRVCVCFFFLIWTILNTVQIFYLGLSKYLGSGWLYQKTKGTL